MWDEWVGGLVSRVRVTTFRGGRSHRIVRWVLRWVLMVGAAVVLSLAFGLLGGASAEAATGDGGLLWRRCTNNDCSKVENETALYRRNGTGFILPGFAGIGWRGTLRMRIAAAETHDGIPTMVDVNATLSWQWLSPNLGVSATAPTWVDAFGVSGLTLDGASIVGSLNVYTGNLPTLTVTSTATLPTLWIDDLQVVVTQPVTFRANLDKTKPIISMHIGNADGVTSLRPLLPTGIPADNTMVAIDDADLVVAPNGGTTGGRTYSPGLWLGFAGSIGGHPLSLNAEYDDDARRLVGNGHLSQLTVGALTMSNWDFDFDIAPGAVNTSVSGSVDLAGGPTFSVAGQVFTTPTCGICVRFTGSAANFSLDSIDVESLGVDLDANLDETTLVNATMDARLRLLGQSVQVAGGISAELGELRRFDISGSASPVCPKPGVCLTGPSPLGGPQFAGHFDGGAADPFDVSFDGNLEADDLHMPLQGHIDQYGADFSGSLVVETIVNVSMSGHFYFGSNLAGQRIKNRSGALVQAQSGDWRADATGSVSTTLSQSRFTGDLLFVAGSVGTEEWVDATGSVNISNPERNSELNGSVTGSFSALSTGLVDYTLTVQATGRFRGLDASGTGIVTPSNVRITANAHVPDLQTSIGFNGNATFICTAGSCSFTYHLDGAADFRLNGFRAHGEFEVDDTTGIRAVVDAQGAKQDMGFTAHFDTTIPDGGTICANASANAWINNVTYSSNGRLDFAGMVSYCNRQITGQLYSGLTYTQYTGEVFDVVGWYRAGVDVHASLTMNVNNNGFVVTGGGTGDVFTEQKFLFTNDWCCRINWAPATLTIANNRISVAVQVMFWDLTLFSEYVPYLTQTFEGWE